ncbi:acyltransferase family protein [Roseicitreum antarcticum]|uniref:Peptidoglycan/LPS O-acetylase OafA/YrhL, contains acyltransferase and SGNH-hydrolase domains n=2 Tax=Roseicitreum antarcticum TaxID=564137 RepID=A0A1H2UKI7_9RHOB|nr:acyltransferase [Roseicitreum antarcticum]SDW56696.1 Peptidoglycan/LPS O-acetylase OafA/YrhL, contains acyltransferase and SGNH-hydrolase domains [Roseicitreum antarcticum]
MIHSSSVAFPPQTRAQDAARLLALDGLRGVAAVIVVVFHYMAMLHPQMVPRYGAAPHWLADTPLAIFWNGEFAVLVFFVLSGFVMAAAAERRADHLLSNTVTRYFRLAIPVTASVLLALFWLTLIPTAARDLAAAMPAPSAWLSYSVQGDLPSVWAGLYDGVAGSFIAGASPINNVLWTMQVELVGSVALFVVYWIGRHHTALRFAALAGFAALGLFLIRDAYLCFVTGALLYEAQKRGLLQRLPGWVGLLALVAGIMLGAPAEGFIGRMELAGVPTRFHPGNTWGLTAVLAATFLMLAALRLAPFATLLSTRLPQWFGRLSFALYLVHVPLLYTFVASAQLNLEMPPGLLFAVYIAMTFAISQAFTLLVDEPSLRMVQRMRRYLAGRRLPGAEHANQVPVVTKPLWPWVLGGMAMIALPALMNGAPFIYFDSVYYVSSTDAIRTALEGLLSFGSDTAATGADLAASAPQLAGDVAMPAGPADGATEVVYRNRSLYFRIIASAMQAVGGGWPMIALYGALTTWMLALIWTRGLGRRLTGRWLAGVGAIGLLTPLGLFAGLAMPDLLAGLLILAVALLVACWHSLTRMQRAILCTTALFAMISHGSHLLLGAALGAGLLATTLRRPGATLGALAVLASVGGAALLDTASVRLLERSDDRTIIHRPHLTAHLIDSQVGTHYLRRHCPESGFAVCAYADQAPMHWIGFLFADHNLPTGPFPNDPVAMSIALSEEQTRFALAVFADAPLRTLGFAMAASAEQLVRFASNGVQMPPAIFEERAITFPGSVQAATRASVIHGNPGLLGALTLTTWIVVLAALIFGGRAARQLYLDAQRRRDALPVGRALSTAANTIAGLNQAAEGRIVRTHGTESRAAQARKVEMLRRAHLHQGLLIVAVLLAGIVLNAVICGVLASPYDRFQARVIWLLPVAMLALVALVHPPKMPNADPEDN